LAIAAGGGEARAFSARRLARLPPLRVAHAGKSSGAAPEPASRSTTVETPRSGSMRGSGCVQVQVKQRASRRVR
jgi:hypothetical protein